MPGGFSLFGHGIGKGLTPVPPPVNLKWTLGALWAISVICAKQGNYGLQRSANGSTGDSDVTSTEPFEVSPGQTLFTSFWVKAGVGADGAIGFGYAFYNSVGTFLSESFITTSSFPADWLQVVGNITVPNFAATAVPIVRALNNLHGLWCVDLVFANKSGGNFSISSLKHYYDRYVEYRS